eukprot:jgi/Bigna1/73365/fgenesh1_pg.24_\
MPFASSSRKAIMSLLGVQILAKIVNFGLNVAIVKQTGRKMYGIGAVPLALLLSTVQFLSREGVRGACRRIDLNALGITQQTRRKRLFHMVNLSWVGVAAAVFAVGPVALFGISQFQYQGVSNAVYFALMASALVELLAEPAFNVYLFGGDIAAIAAFAIVTMVLRGRFFPDHCARAPAGVDSAVWHSLFKYGAYHICTGAAQLPALKKPDGTPLSLGSLMPSVDIRRNGVLMCPKSKNRKKEDEEEETQTALIDNESKGVALALSAQNVVKWVLTEGDKIILMSAKAKTQLSSSTAASGGNGGSANEDMDAVYGVVFNLGSLLGRLVFEPVETHSRVQFDKLSSARLSLQQEEEGEEEEKQSKGGHKESGALLAYKQKWREICELFAFRTRFLLTIAGIILSLGPSYTWLLLHLLYREKYSNTDAPVVLSWYCLYVFLMAFNGMLEALRDSAATREQLASRSPFGLTGFMLITFVFSSSVAYSIVPQRYDFAGCVWKRGDRMVKLRESVLQCVGSDCVHSLAVYRGSAKNMMKDSAIQGLAKALPSRIVIGTMVASGLICKIASPRGPMAEASLMDHALHVAVGALCGLMILASVWASDRDIRREAATVIKALPVPAVLKRHIIRFDDDDKID